MRRARHAALCALGVLVLGSIAGCGGGGGGGASACGGAANTLCAAGSFCDYADLSCGATEGECKPIPADCSVVGAFPTVITGPVCSCAGLDFFSACDAAAAGQSVRGAGDC